MQRKLIIAAVGLVLGIATVAALQLHKIESRLNAIREQTAQAGKVAFTLRRLNPAAHTVLFEPLDSTNEFTAGAVFRGRIYLAGPGGLAVYSHEQPQPVAPIAMLRTGIELPAQPITALTVGHLRGEASTTLIAATRGGGVLLIDGDNGLRQLRPNEAADADITAVLALSSGDLVLGTRRAGVLLYDGTTLRAFSPALRGLSITALAGDEGDLWIGTRTQGLMHWQAGTVSALGPADGLPDPLVNSIVVAPHGDVLAATPLGVARIRDGRVERVLAQGVFGNALGIDSRKLLVATLDQGVREVPLDVSGTVSSLAPITTPRSGSADATPVIGAFFQEDSQLFAVSGGSLLVRHDREWQTVVASAPQALTARNVSALAADAQGRLWVGYFDQGLDVLDPSTNHAQHFEDDHLFCINRIAMDPQRGTVDVATANGLALFDEGSLRPRQVLTRRDGLISDQVTDIAFTRDGMALATPAGLTFFTPSGAQSLYAFQGLVNNHVYTIAAQPLSERVFAGTLGGISILDNEAVLQNVTLQNSALRRNWITALARVELPGQPATWFVGTYGGGVMQMDASGRVSAVQMPDALAVINPHAILATPSHVFVGSLSAGLFVYTIATQHWMQMTTDLPSLNVTAFAWRAGTVYIGTDNGVVRVDESRLP